MKDKIDYDIISGHELSRSFQHYLETALLDSISVIKTPLPLANNTIIVDAFVLLSMCGVIL